jgi:hypothetical protein
MSFILLVVLPASQFLKDPVTQYAVLAGGVLFGGNVTSIMYAAPKVYKAYTNAEEAKSMDSSSTTTASSKMISCPSCKFVFEPAGSNVSATRNSMLPTQR